jgi:ferredoxin
MLTAQQVKEYARRCGADVVGVTSMDRFEGAPKQMDPRYIFPDAKAMVVLGFRILRGALRGVEEGTFFIAYSGMGYAGINHVRQPMVLWDLCRWMEDQGYETVPMPNDWPWPGTDILGDKPEIVGPPRPDNFSRPVSPDKPAPDVVVHLRIAAFCAGLGEIGYGKLLLTPEFGPRQRLAAVLTDAPLEPDALFEGELCDRCMLCVRDCSGKAISGSETIKVTVAGRELEWGKIDYNKCSKAFCGGSPDTNPFMMSPEDEAGFNQHVWTAQKYKLPPTYDYGRAIEGAAGCMRACMVHLEQQGKLKNVFHNPFRRRKPWRL